MALEVRKIIQCLWLASAALVIYAPALKAQTIYDDAIAAQDEKTSAKESNGETVRAAIVAALSHNPQLDFAKANIKAAKADRFAALGGFLPSITASAEYTDDSLRSNSLETLNSRDGVTLGLRVRQPVFEGLSTVNRWRESKARLAQAEFSHAGAQEQIALSAARVHAGVILAREIVTHRQQNLALVREQFRITEARMKAGAQSRTGVEQARMRVAQAQASLEEARATLGANEAAYIQIVGHEAPIGLAEDETGISIFTSEEDAIGAARASNPAVNAARRGLAAAKFAKNAARGDLAPNLAIEGNFFKRSGGDDTLRADDEYQIVARLEAPLFAQGTNYAGVRRASSGVIQGEAQLRDTNLAVIQTVSQNWSAYVTAKARVDAAQRSTEAAALSVEGLRIEYEAGRRTVIDVLDGQRDLVDTAISLSQARFDLRAAQYELAAAAGSLATTEDNNLRDRETK